MFGIGPTEMIFFLVILLLVVGPERLPTFMRTVGKGVRQVRNASREFKEAIGLDELMREGDPFRPQPVRPPRARPVPIEEESTEPEILSESTTEATTESSSADGAPRTVPPPLPQSLDASEPSLEEPKPLDEKPETSTEPDASPEANLP